MKIRIAGGGEVAYEIRGGGEPAVLLLHAFPFDRRMWAGTIEAIAPRRRVIALDCRGFGDSPVGPGGHGIENFAEDAAAVLDASGAGRAIVCGLSMGGYVALALCRLRAPRIAGLALCDTQAGADGPEARRARDEAIALCETQGRDAYLAKSLPRLLSPAAPAALREHVAALARQPLKAIVAGLRALRDRPDRTGELAAIGCPTVCLAGADDTVTPPALARAMAQAIPGAGYREIAGAGHLANLEQPAAFHAALHELVERVA